MSSCANSNTLTSKSCLKLNIYRGFMGTNHITGYRAYRLLDLDSFPEPLTTLVPSSSSLSSLDTQCGLHRRSNAIHKPKMWLSGRYGFDIIFQNNVSQSKFELTGGEEAARTTPCLVSSLSLYIQCNMDSPSMTSVTEGHECLRRLHKRCIHISGRRWGDFKC